MPSAGEDDATLQLDGRDVVVTHPSKLLIPDANVRKLDLVNYYVAVAEGALRGAGGRPCVLVRYPDGIGGEFFFQKRAPAKRPPGLEVASIRFPSGRSAEEIVSRRAADLAWMANLACLELHPHPVRADDLDHPDELRVDLDPVPGVEWPQIRQVASVVHEALTDAGITGWPKTSGSRGLHVLVRIERRWSFDQVRRAGWRWRATSSAVRPASPAAPGGRRSARAFSSTTTRTRRTAPSRRPTRCARSPTRASRCPSHGRNWTLRPGRFHAVDGAQALAHGRRPPRGHRCPPRLDRAAARALGAPRGRWPG